MENEGNRPKKKKHCNHVNLMSCLSVLANSAQLHSHQHGKHTEKRLFAKGNNILKRKINRKI